MRRKIQKEYNDRPAAEQRYSVFVIMVKSKNGKGTMLRALCDSGCSKTIILKEFTEKENRRYLNENESLKYKTYGGYFASSSVASISFKLT